MDASLKVEIFTICIWQLAAIIALIIAFSILYMKANRTASLRAFFYVQFTIVLWLSGKILKTVSPNVDLRWNFIVLYYLAICLLEVAFLEFGYTYYKGRTFKKKTKVLIYILPIIQFIVIMTNPYHHLFYSSFDFYHDKFGVLFYVHVFIEYIYIISGMVFCAIKLHKQFIYKKVAYRIYITFITLGPITLNLLYISRVLQKVFSFAHISVIFDVTPIVFTWSLLHFIYAAFKYEFFDLTPVMRHEIVHKLATPICIVDFDCDILFANNTLLNDFEFDKNPNRVIDLLADNRKCLVSQESESCLNNSFEFDGRHYLFFSKKITSIDGTRYIVVFNEITSYVVAKEQIGDENRELELINESLNKQIKILKDSSKIGARNFVARELHDIIGHSLVVCIKLLEVAKISYINGNYDNVASSLEKAKLVTKSGIEDMKKVNTKCDSVIYNGRMLKKEIDSILEKMGERLIVTNVFFKGENQVLEQQVSDIIKKVITELFTNTLKHSQATRLFLSCKIDDGVIAINYMDNGIGAKSLNKGNGLMGIESRIKLIGGNVDFDTSENNGFNANIKIYLD